MTGQGLWIPAARQMRIRFLHAAMHGNVGPRLNDASERILFEYGKPSGTRHAIPRNAHQLCLRIPDRGESLRSIHGNGLWKQHARTRA